MALDAADIREAYDYDLANWQEIRDEAKTDIDYVAGNPWTKDDLKQRKGRPTVAPEEMGQYRNQVINQLRANPIGMKFSPVGGGASEAGARFYQNKAREIEYRSHASIAYIQAADNALQRSYGFVRVTTKYASDRSANQDLWIEGFPNPNMVLMDSDSLRPDSSDAKRCFVFRWMPIAEFKKHPEFRNAKITAFSDYSATAPNWVKSNRILLSEYWAIETSAKPLHLARVDGHEFQMFDEELEQARAIGSVEAIRKLRDVEIPKVTMYMTNGLEVLSEHQWLGKYIPIVSCYGTVLYTEQDQGMKRVMLSMTRFGRAPWKSFCYACSQQLEVLGMTPKAPLMIPRGSMNANELRAVEESTHQPKAYLTYDDGGESGTGQRRTPPQRAEYVQSQYLESLEMVKEGFRRSIQAAMGSNFLPTQAQRRNEKSGVALDKMDQSASTGTFHFVDNYHHMVRQVGVISEDLIDKIHSYQGETGVIEPDGKAKSQPINIPGNEESVSTKGDYLVTVSVGQSSDSAREAAQDFTDLIVGKLDMIAQVSGPKVAAAVLAKSIKARLNSPEGDQLADLIEPPEYKQQDGQKPPSPEVMALKQQLSQAQQMLQKASQDHDGKVVEQKGKMAIVQVQEKAETDRQLKLKRMDIAGKILAARVTAAKQTADLQAEASEERIALALDAIAQSKDHSHEATMAILEHHLAGIQSERDHQQALEQGAQQAALAPDPNAAPSDGAPA